MYQSLAVNYTQKSFFKKGQGHQHWFQYCTFLVQIFFRQKFFNQILFSTKKKIFKHRSIYIPKCAESNFKKLSVTMFVFLTFLKKDIREKLYFWKNQKISIIVFFFNLLNLVIYTMRIILVNFSKKKLNTKKFCKFLCNCCVFTPNKILSFSLCIIDCSLVFFSQRTSLLHSILQLSMYHSRHIFAAREASAYCHSSCRKCFHSLGQRIQQRAFSNRDCNRRSTSN